MKFVARGTVLGTAAVLFTSAMLLATASASAGSPTLVPVQGVLTDDTDKPVTGIKSLKFSIYTSEIGGSPAWTETQTVTVVDGFFSTYLGDDTALNLELFKNNTNMWLGVQVDSGQEQSPRTYIGTAPYTAFAEYCGSVPSHTHPFSEITGSLPVDRYSAYANLGAEGYLNNNAGADLLTRDQCDARYSLTTHNHAGTYALFEHSHNYTDLPITVARRSQDNDFVMNQTMPTAAFTVNTGTAPFSVASTTQVANLNSDMLDGVHASAFAASAHNHAASDLTSGVLPIARGGTGSSTQNFVDLTTDQTAAGTKTFNSLALAGDADAQGNILKNPVLGMLSYTASFAGGETSGTIARYDGFVQLTAYAGTPAWIQDQPGYVMIDDLYRRGNYLAANVMFSTTSSCGSMTNYVLFGGNKTGSVWNSFGFKSVGTNLYGVTVDSSGVQSLTPSLQSISCQARYRLIAVMRSRSLLELFVNGVSKGTLAIVPPPTIRAVTGYTLRTETTDIIGGSALSVNMLTIAQPF